ncbi:fimbrial protein [Entomohabitans teleogrylli]|uniref:fimbrial protein n=1 Tax=Entomohabitans teleogrylli TaxID=1384589 RepID=UPI00073DAA6F|nr:hypothetical protein [Entomohabitans teleogrylli]
MVKKLFVIFMALMFCAALTPAQALECHQGSATGTTSEKVNIGNVKIPRDVPDGTIVWRSEVQTNTFVCWSTTTKYEEYVYIYTYPRVDTSAVMPPGIKFGIIYNGIDLGTESTKTQTDLFFEKKESTKNKKQMTMSYQVYIQKTGPLNNEIVFNTDEVAVFQLDGANDINNKEGKNYRYTLTGLSNLMALACSASIPEVTEVDFGELKPWDSVGQELVRRDFSIPVSRNCDAPFALDAIFTPTGNLQGSNGADLGNGAVLKLYDSGFNEFIDFNKKRDFADLTVDRNVTRKFQAVLFSNGQATPGAFETDIIFIVNYK